jgi:hypothetical protein
MPEPTPQDAAFIRDLNRGLREAVILLGLIWLMTIGLLVAGIVLTPYGLFDPPGARMSAIIFYVSMAGCCIFATIRVLIAARRARVIRGRLERGAV